MSSKTHSLIVASTIYVILGLYAAPLEAFQPSHSILKRERATSSSTAVLLAMTRVKKTDEEWKEELPQDAYHVLREAGTEPPGSSKLNNVKKPGVFVCRGCGAPLFQSDTKFDSGTGWPSFYAPIDTDAVVLDVDFELIVPRTEVRCASCDGHLGHVFDDGPDPTGQRYCMNGVAMEFRSAEEDPDLVASAAKRSLVSPFKPSIGTVLPGIVINGAIGVFFFSSILSRISDVEAAGGSPMWYDYFLIIPAVYYGVMAGRRITRLL